MRFKNFVLGSCCLTLAWAVPACSSSPKAPNMNEGRWEISASVEMANMPFPIPPMTYSQCLTKEDLIPQQDAQGSGGGCDVTTKTIKGDTVTWTMVCNAPQGKTTSTGSITYSGDSFNGTVKVEGPGMPSMTQKMSGRRVGDCK